LMAILQLLFVVSVNSERRDSATFWCWIHS